MQEVTIRHEWIFEHKHFIPWHLFVGAEIVTESGLSMHVKRVTPRGWPLGPLIDVSYGNPSSPKQCTYNIQGFQVGFLHEVKFHAPIGDAVQSLLSKAESDSKASKLAECAERAAAAAAQELVIARQQAAVRAEELRHQTQVANYLDEQMRISAHRQQIEDRLLKQAVQVRVAKVGLLKQRMLAKQQYESRQMEAFIENHRIPFLVHFTRIENLPSILEQGIVARAQLSPGFVSNDNARLDEFLEASCLTVGYPNWSMFYKYQCQDARFNWAVLTVSPEVLTALPCLFHASNAASAQFKDKNDESLESRMGLHGLETMFYDEPQGLRSSRELPSYWTTDPQAEVLVFETIPVGFIKSVSLLRRDVDVEKKVADLAPGMKCFFGGTLFSPRSDYRFWQSHR